MSIVSTVLTGFLARGKQASAASKRGKQASAASWVCCVGVSAGCRESQPGKLHFPSTFELNASKNGTKSNQEFCLHHLQGTF